MAKYLVIVESPAKVKTIKKFQWFTTIKLDNTIIETLYIYIYVGNIDV